MKRQAVLSLSGGMDSSTLLLHLLSNGYEVTALSFDYGQKHSIELKRAQELVEYLNMQHLRSDKIMDYPPVRYQTITLDGLSQLLNSSLVTGTGTPLLLKSLVLSSLASSELACFGVNVIKYTNTSTVCNSTGRPL